MDVPRLPDPVARAYAGALHAIALADRELTATESARLDQLLERRCPGVDREDLKRLLPAARDQVRAATGRDWLDEAVRTVPGVGAMLGG